MSEQDQITQERMFVSALFDLVDNEHSLTFTNLDGKMSIFINGVATTFHSVYTEYPGTRLVQAIAAVIPKKEIK